MSIKTELSAIATDLSLGFFEGIKSFQSVTADSNTTWPIVYLDNPKRFTPTITVQETIETEWNIFISILDQDEADATEAETNAIIETCRGKLNRFLVKLIQKEDATGRKVFQSVVPSEAIDIRKIFAEVLSGVGVSVRIIPVDKYIEC